MDVLEQSHSAFEAALIDTVNWATSGYLPTPTIIEAATALYQSHNVVDIARSDSGAKTLLRQVMKSLA